MRVALAGKGGAGKTTISATLARLLAAHMPVLAVDADSNPNLATALGLPPGELPRGAVVPSNLVSRRLDGPALNAPLDELLDNHAVLAPDDVRLLLMGAPAHADVGCLCSAHATVSALLADLGTRPDIATVIDMEASPEHVSRGTARHVDTLLLVTEPYYRSLETVKRLAQLARELPIPTVAVVANKVRSATDLEGVKDFCQRHDLAVVAVIPRSEAVVDADAARIPLLDEVRAGNAGNGGREVVAAIGGLATHLIRRPVEEPTIAGR